MYEVNTKGICGMIGTCRQRFEDKEEAIAFCKAKADRFRVVEIVEVDAHTVKEVLVWSKEKGK